MQKLKAYLAIILLAALAPVMVPKDVWHHCSDEAAASHARSHETGAEHIEQLCDICKVQATTFTPSVMASLPKIEIETVAYALPLHDLVAASPLLLLPQRAPPVA